MCMKKKLDVNSTRTLRAISNPGGNIPTKENPSCLATYHPSRKLPKLDEQDMQDTARVVRTNPLLMYLKWTPSHGRLNVRR